jgi:tripartite-type tricarboxylate transporter receptor subunit TctC
VPYNAGGGTDASTRAVAKQLAVVWGQPVIVENAPGADGLIGTRKVIDAKPDGHTLLVQIPSLTMIKYTPALKGIDPVAQLAPITVMSQSPSVTVVNAKVPGKTLAEVVQYCKTANPPCSIGTTENLARIFAKILADQGGIKELIVANYKGGGGMISDLLSNNVNMSFMGLASSLPHYKAGTVKILAVNDRKRASFLPEVPTVAEAGFPEIRSVSWFGLFAPKGTAQPVIDGVAAAVRESIKDPAVLKAFAAVGAEPVGNTPKEFAALVREESERNGALVKRYPMD